MGSTLEINLTIKRDGKLLAGFPFARRIQCDEMQEFSYEQINVGAGVYGTIASTAIETLQALVITPTNQAVTFRLNGQSDAGIPVNAGGLLLLIDTTIASGVSTNATVNNVSGSTVTLDGLAGGT